MKTDATGRALRQGQGRRLALAALLVGLTATLAWGSAQSSSGSHRSSGSASAPKGGKAANTTASSASTPAASTIRHRVLKGENLYRIALNYGITVEDLCRVNGIQDQGLVTEGQVVFVPPASPARSTSSAASASRTRTASSRPAEKSTPPSPVKMASAFPTSGSNGAQLIKTADRILISNLDEPTPRETAVARDASDVETEEIPRGDGSPEGISFTLIPSEEPFSWPVQGGIVRSPFGMRHGRQHAGIDISAPMGTPIYAARDGIVSYSGHRFHGYGNVVMLDHGDGFMTVYAHNVANLVREGDAVVRGQMIARVGATGNATGAHCHFEIRNDNLSVNPRSYLCESPEEDVIFAKGLPPQALARPRRAALPESDMTP